MLNRIFPQIKLLLALLFFTFLPVLMWGGTAQAGHIQPSTDIEESRLVNYWDLRNRQSFFQVTNTSAAPVSIHIQIFDSGNSCFEFDFFDDLTAFDTHIYDLSNLTRNNGAPLSAPDLSGGHGIVGVSVVTGSGGSFTNSRVLAGNFRISSENFEYRTNSIGLVDNSAYTDEYAFNFNNVDLSTFADVVLVSVNDTSSGIDFDSFYSITPLKLDANENPISCPSLDIDCEAGGLNTEINYGINQAITNSRGAPSLCLGTDTTGVMFIDFDSDDIPVGFIGLNNGDGTGSMDSIHTHDDFGSNSVIE